MQHFEGSTTDNGTSQKVEAEPKRADANNTNGVPTAEQKARHRAELLSKVNDAIVWSYLSLSVTVWLVVPSLISAMVLAYFLLGKLWTCVIFACHLMMALIKARYHVLELVQGAAQAEVTTKDTTKETSEDIECGEISHDESSLLDIQLDNADETNDQDNTSGAPASSSRCPSSFLWITTLSSLMDIILFGGVYSLIMMVFTSYIFLDEDGTVVIEWKYYHHCMAVLKVLSCVIVVLRITIGTRMLISRSQAAKSLLSKAFHTVQSIPYLGNFLGFVYYQGWVRFKVGCSTPPKYIHFEKTTATVVAMAFLFLLWSAFLAMLHVGRFQSAPYVTTAACDPLDATECALPFPSAYHLREDTATASGYRVNVKPETFAPLKGLFGDTPMSVDFLNKMDGFSTMGPLLFYMEGMKDSHDAYLQAVQERPSLKTEPGITRLRGTEELGLSITPYSTTLLLDVDNNILVPHSAEIDYLDSARPLVMVFPASPLRHNAHYALAVVNATDVHGKPLPAIPGMVEMFEQKESSRYHLFTQTILPALTRATRKQSNDTGQDWSLRSDVLGGLQLLFDFRTASSASQLGSVKAVRDAALAHVNSDWSWEDDTHVRLVRSIEGNCEDPIYPVARTLHVELDVPWFMESQGAGSRGALLDKNAVENGAPNGIGKAKCVIYVPCSLKQAALGGSNETEAHSLRAVMEYGHGLFGSKAEAGDPYVIRMAHDNGYIIVAMDWRGMSKYDLPLIARTMISEPSLFESVRDNLIQGYANKFVLQHFIHNGMLEKEWFQFQTSEASDLTIPRLIANESSDLINNEIPSVFWGLSQGGVLGAGYVGLCGRTRYISRAGFNVPGAGFAFVLSRSAAFAGYNIALLTNFQNSRHVRIFLSLSQMMWDSVEGAGVLALPIEGPLPPILIQTGLGDNVVPAVTAERLARAVGAHTLASNPKKDIFGIPEESNAGAGGATLQEILYQDDYANLPANNGVKAQHNWVHDVARLDPSFQIQMAEFFNTGNIIDPCGEDGTKCIRERASKAKKCIPSFDAKDGDGPIEFCE